MPMTRSEIIYFAAGVAVGAAARSTYPILKEKLGPLIAGAMASASAAFSDSYADVAKRLAEKAEAVQDVVAPIMHAASNNGAPHTTAEPSTASRA
jgi:hypothetical protein